MTVMTTIFCDGDHSFDEYYEEYQGDLPDGWTKRGENHLCPGCSKHSFVGLSEKEIEERKKMDMAMYDAWKDAYLQYEPLPPEVLAAAKEYLKK